MANLFRFITLVVTSLFFIVMTLTGLGLGMAGPTLLVAALGLANAVSAVICITEDN